MRAEIQFLQNVFRDVAEASAFLTSDGKLICAQAKRGVNFLSPVHAARFVLQYFPLQDQDWVALNDPFGGGSTPFGLNFVGRIQNVIWSVRLESPIVWSLEEKWESLGPKIPPLPLLMGGEKNPQIPPTFWALTEPYEARIRPHYEKLEIFLKWKADGFSASRLQNYFSKSEKWARDRFQDVPWNEIQHKAKTASAETLSVKVGLSTTGALVDFTGTSLPSQMALHEKFTESIVTFALTRALSLQEIYNHGTESFFQIVKPKQSWLNEKELRHPARVHLLAVPFLESHLKQMLLKMKFPVEDWKCSKEGWMQLQSALGQTITSDEIQATWAQRSSWLKVIGTSDLALQYELTQPARLLRIESGQFEQLELRQGAQFEVRLI